MIDKSNIIRGLRGILIASVLSTPAIANDKTTFEKNIEQLRTLTEECESYLENNPPSEYYKSTLEEGMNDIEKYLDSNPTKGDDVNSIGSFWFIGALEGRGRNSSCYGIPDALTNIANDEYTPLKRN